MAEEEQKKQETEKKTEEKETPPVEAGSKKEETVETPKSEEKIETKNSEDKPEEKKPEEKKEGAKIKEKGVTGWEPKTKLGREVKDGKIRDIDEILKDKRKILESEIIDNLIDVESELINIGQSKGKFGGGKRRIWRQTQRKTEQKNVVTFSTLAVIGDGKGHLGIGTGKSKETLPAREKAIRKAKLNIIKIRRTCSGFDCSCSELHTIPFKSTGKSGSVRVTLIPASQGTGLVVANELKKVLKLAGIKDVYSKTFGKKRTSFNLIKAGVDALKRTSR